MITYEMPPLVKEFSLLEEIIDKSGPSFSPFFGTRFLLLPLKVIAFLARGFVPLAHGALFTFFKDSVLMLESLSNLVRIL